MELVILFAVLIALDRHPYVGPSTVMTALTVSSGSGDNAGMDFTSA